MFTYMTHAAQASGVRVSNYYAGVLRIVQRDAKANGMFVQLTSPWRQQVLLGTLCHEWGSSEEFGWITKEQTCAFSFSSILRWFDALWSGGIEEKHFPGPKRVTFSQLSFWRLCCFVQRDWAEIALQERDGQIRLPGCVLPCHRSPQMMQTFDEWLGCAHSSQNLVLESKPCLSALAPAAGRSLRGGFARHSVEMANLQGAKAA